MSHDRSRLNTRTIGHDIARNTVKRILQDHGIEPAPERVRRRCRRRRVHREGLADCDGPPGFRMGLPDRTKSDAQRQDNRR